MLNAGTLDRRIKILRGARTDDGFQRDVISFQVVGTVWAARFDMSDREALVAGQVLGEVVTKFRVRSSNLTRTVTPSDRLLCDGREYNITGVKEFGQRDVLEITSIARADQ